MRIVLLVICKNLKHTLTRVQTLVWLGTLKCVRCRRVRCLLRFPWKLSSVKLSLRFGLKTFTRSRRLTYVLKELELLKFSEEWWQFKLASRVASNSHALSDSCALSKNLESAQISLEWMRAQLSFGLKLLPWVVSSRGDKNSSFRRKFCLEMCCLYPGWKTDMRLHENRDELWVVPLFPQGEGNFSESTRESRVFARQATFLRSRVSVRKMTKQRNKKLMQRLLRNRPKVLTIILFLM